MYPQTQSLNIFKAIEAHPPRKNQTITHPVSSLLASPVSIPVGEAKQPALCLPSLKTYPCSSCISVYRLKARHIYKHTTMQQRKSSTSPLQNELDAEYAAAHERNANNDGSDNERSSLHRGQASWCCVLCGSGCSGGCNVAGACCSSTSRCATRVLRTLSGETDTLSSAVGHVLFFVSYDCHKTDTLCAGLTYGLGSLRDSRKSIT
jgi:hypothetical protein